MSLENANILEGVPVSHTCRIALSYKWESSELGFSRDELRSTVADAIKQLSEELERDIVLDDFELGSEANLSLEIPEWLFKSCVCLFELSSLNAENVWYELGLARGIGKRCVLLCLSDRFESIPSDLRGLGLEQYKGLKQLGPQIKRNLKSILQNPIRPTGAMAPAARVHQDRDAFSLQDLLDPSGGGEGGTFVSLGSSFRAVYGWSKKTFRQLLEKGWTFKFYAATDEMARQRAIEEGADPTDSFAVERLVVEKGNLLRRARELEPLSRTGIEIYEYERFPTMHVTLINEERYYINPYPPNNEGMSAPVFEFYECPFAGRTLEGYHDVLETLRAKRIWPPPE